VAANFLDFSRPSATPKRDDDRKRRPVSKPTSGLIPNEASIATLPCSILDIFPRRSSLYRVRDKIGLHIHLVAKPIVAGEIYREKSTERNLQREIYREKAIGKKTNGFVSGEISVSGKIRLKENFVSWELCSVETAM
jgi:hypothetical protein